MIRSLFGLLLLLFICQPLLLWSQANIRLGQWRSHFSYRSANSLAIANERVYAASENGLYYFDLEDNSISVLTALQGLNDVGISSLNHQADKNILFIAYRSGNIDLIQDGKVFNVDAVLNASLPGRRKINHVLFVGASAFLSTDYGISVLDLDSKGLHESYFNLGPAGEASEVFHLAVWNDSLFAATQHGLIANALKGANLSDFSSWRRYEEAELPVSGEIKTLAANSEGLYAGMNEQGLLNYRNGVWQETAFKTEKIFHSIKAAKGGFLIALEDALYSFNTANGNFSSISSPLIGSPIEAGIDQERNYWVADRKRGLLSDFEGSFKSYVPQGPLADVAESLYADEKGLVAVYEQVGENSQQNGLAGGFSVFKEGNWVNYTSEDVPGMPDISGFSDVVRSPVNGKYYLSSLSEGLLEWDPATNSFQHFTAAMEGVSLQLNTLGQTPVSRLATDGSGQVWMVQPGTTIPLHRYDPSGNTWQGYLQNNTKAGSAGEILVLPNYDKWLQLAGKNGILVFNEEKDQSRYLTDQTSSGGLLHKEVRSLALDLDGQVWVGLEQGVNYFPNPQSVLTNAEINAAWPIYERRQLLNSEEVTSLEVDGGNRKWMGTPSGVWVVGDYGDTIYHNFTAENSLLPHNQILSQAIMQQSGEVFIATPAGLVSYRSGATAAGFQHAAAIKVYPNPVDPAYNGKVGITGLASDVIVKITDVSGRLVKELASEGGTASWDLTDTQGRRPPTGVYLIFSTSVDGVETMAGKLAIIN